MLTSLNLVGTLLGAPFVRKTLSFQITLYKGKAGGNTSYSKLLWYKLD